MHSTDSLVQKPNGATFVPTGTTATDYAELQLTTLYYNRPHPAPQILPKNSNLTAVSYGQTRCATFAAFGQLSKKKSLRMFSIRNAKIHRLCLPRKFPFNQAAQ